jgi:N-carbamoyl-L-amino-acid hydrolase
MDSGNLRINGSRLLGRIAELARIGAIDGGGVCRMALTDEDRAGRDQVIGWMRELGLRISIDKIGNVVGIRPGRAAGAPVTTGSHIDSVATGGRYDGTLGVLAGLEVIETLNEAAIETRRPLALAFFTNEEGARFAPDMMGSMVQQGHIPLRQALDSHDADGVSVAQELARIGYSGDADCDFRAHAFVELHVEQGPVLEREGIGIGAVEGVQGISWTEIRITGVSNHAGTTPMALRHDAGYAAAAIAVFVRELAREMGGSQVATVGKIDLVPNLVNVIAKQAVLTVDLRNTDEALLQQAEQRLHEYLDRLIAAEGVGIGRRTLARFEPVAFDPCIIAGVEQTAASMGLSVRRMPSGAGHDAQAFAPNCPTGMIFVPSVDGISHNVREFTAAGDIEAGANVLLNVLLQLSEAD